MEEANNRLYRLAVKSNNVEAIKHFESKMAVNDIKKLAEKNGNFSTTNYSCEYRDNNGKTSFHFFDRIKGKIISVVELKKRIG